MITPVTAGDPVRILSTADGRVYELDSRRAALVAALLRAQTSHALVSLTLDTGERIVAAGELPPADNARFADKLDETEAVAPLSADENTSGTGPTVADSHGLGYLATNLPSMSDAQSLFDSLPQLRHHSQCFQRAHVWAYQLYQQRSISSMKVFLFFTRAFIQQHHYKWWFHVAPFVYVQGAEIVLDPEFVDEPRGMHDWTDFFMMDRGSVRPPLATSPDCTEVASYTDYDDNQFAQYCYTLKLPMYYYQPLDAQNLAENGTRVETFRDWDVQNSRRAVP